MCSAPPVFALALPSQTVAPAPRAHNTGYLAYPTTVSSNVLNTFPVDDVAIQVSALVLLLRGAYVALNQLDLACLKTPAVLTCAVMTPLNLLTVPSILLCATHTRLT